MLAAQVFLPEVCLRTSYRGVPETEPVGRNMDKCVHLACHIYDLNEIERFANEKISVLRKEKK